MTKEQRIVLAHVVIDPDAWWAHAVKVFGEAKAGEMLAAKVARHKSDYELSMQKGGYKTRAERELQL